MTTVAQGTGGAGSRMFKSVEMGMDLLEKVYFIVFFFPGESEPLHQLSDVTT